jgi:type II secretory ATPase GspE/PulE/Tfp pilus assembly ATPase PilB-like protein
MNLFGKPKKRDDSAIRRFVQLLLFQVQQDQATELVIGATPATGDTPIRYKVEGTWRDLPPFPSHIRPEVVSELAQMAGFPAGQIPGEGVLDVSFGEVRLRWMVGMTDADGECRLVRVED